MNIKRIKVWNLESSRSNRPVANQFVIETTDGNYFQSYKTIIAFIDCFGRITLDFDSWNYSVTTLKYLKVFLNTSLSKQEIQKQIDNGFYKTANLN